MATAILETGRGPVLLIVIWAWAGVATIVYLLRAWNASRASHDKRSFFGLRWDFFWVTIAYVDALCANAFITVSVLYGTGNHQLTLDPHQAVFSALWSWIGQICAIFALVWGRFAVIAFLRALQGPTYPKFRYALYVVGAFQAVINTIEVILILNQCSPAQKLWNFELPGTCNLIGICSKVGFFQGGIGAFADFFLALYPPAVIIGPLQQMKISIKIGLCIIMGGGVCAGVAGIMKTISIEGITHTQDISYATVDLLIWVLTEVWFIIIFGSLPTIRTVLQTAGHRVKTITQGSARNTTNKSSKHSHSRSNDWMELSAREGGKPGINDGYESEYAAKNGLVTRVNHVQPAYKQYRGGQEYGSEEDILAPGRDDIVITKELTVTRHSDDAL